MKLVEEGKIKLDDTLGDFFPEYSSCPFYGEVSKVTVRNLLRMRSGISDFVNDPEGFWGEETGSELVGTGNPSGEDFCNFFNKYGDKIVRQAFCRKPGFEQDIKFEYSNTNYTLLAGIIEKKSGMSYAGFMEQTVFKPCGMTDTTSMKEGNVQASIRKNAWYNPVNFRLLTEYLIKTARGSTSSCALTRAKSSSCRLSSRCPDWRNKCLARFML